MGLTIIATDQRPLHTERRDAKLERQRARRQDREAKRSRTQADAFGQLAALLDDAGWRAAPVAAPAETQQPAASADVAPTQALAARPPIRPPTSEPSDRPERPQRGSRFQHARQEAADWVRDTATAIIAAAVDRAGERRAGENAVVRDALQTLVGPDARPWPDITKRIRAAIASGNAKELLWHAKRAVWQVAKDVANAEGSDGYRLAAGRVCAALAVIERLPVATVRSGEPSRIEREPATTGAEQRRALMTAAPSRITRGGASSSTREVEPAVRPAGAGGRTAPLRSRPHPSVDRLDGC